MKKHIDGKIRRERGWSGFKLWIYFDHADTDVLPRKDKSDIALDLGGTVYVGTVSLNTTHPPYLLTNLKSPNGLRSCTEVFGSKGWDNGTVLRFEVVEPRKTLKFLKVVSTVRPRPSPEPRAQREQPVRQGHWAATATNQTDVVRDRLLQFAKTIPPEELFPTLAEGAAELVADNPFAFLLAASLDRGTKAEVIWTIPFWLREELGHLDPKRLASMTREQVSEALAHMPRKPRYVNDAPQTIIEVARLVSERLSGDAEALWRYRTAHEVKRELRHIHGIGEGISAMCVILLQNCRGVRFPDSNTMDVKPDVHVRRVLYRLGVAERHDEAGAIAAAARLNPEFPGAVDPSLWVIGRRWCKESMPLCAACVINDLCLKVGL